MRTADQIPRYSASARPVTKQSFKDRSAQAGAWAPENRLCPAARGTAPAVLRISARSAPTKSGLAMCRSIVQGGQKEMVTPLFSPAPGKTPTLPQNSFGDVQCEACSRPAMRYRLRRSRQPCGMLRRAGPFPPIGPLFAGRFHPLELLSTAAKGPPRALTP
jgi:hypothetical protein